MRLYDFHVWFYISYVYFIFVLFCLLMWNKWNIFRYICSKFDWLRYDEGSIQFHYIVKMYTTGNIWWLSSNCWPCTVLWSKFLLFTWNIIYLRAWNTKNTISPHSKSPPMNSNLERMWMKGSSISINELLNSTKMSISIFSSLFWQIYMD